MKNSRSRRLVRQKAALPRREANLKCWNASLSLQGEARGKFLGETFSGCGFVTFGDESIKGKIVLCESEIATLKTRIGGGA